MSILAVSCVALTAQSSDAVRREIETTYVKAINALQKAKAIEDLDEINRSVDTYDWQSIVPGQPGPRSWSELRKYGFAGLWAPFQSIRLEIETFELSGDTAVLTGKLRVVNSKGSVGFLPLKETWRKTVVGWKRAIHQKFLTVPAPH